MISYPKTNRLSIVFCFLLSACLFSLLLMACSNNETTKNATSSNNTNNLEQQFELDIKHYIDSYNSANWDEVRKTTFEAIYTGKTKDEVITDYVQLSLMGVNRQTNFIKIEKVTPVVETAGNLYAKIYYGANVKVYLSGESVEKEEFIKYNLELSYDTNDVLFDKNQKTLSINDAYCSMFAISKKGSNIWKYIEVDQQKAPFLSQVIPEKTLNILNNY